MENIKEFIEKEFKEIGPAYSEVYSGLLGGSISIKEARLRNKATDERLKRLKQTIKELSTKNKKGPEK